MELCWIKNILKKKIKKRFDFIIKIINISVLNITNKKALSPASLRVPAGHQLDYGLRGKTKLAKYGEFFYYMNYSL